MIPTYRANPYQSELHTVASAVLDDGDTQLITPRELIFAEGGGQPRDYGFVEVNSERREVLELAKHKGDTRLRVRTIAGLERGAALRCEIDFARRFRIMRLHTLQHALAGAIRKCRPDYQSAGMQICEAAESCQMNFELCSKPLGSKPLVIEEPLEILKRAIATGSPVVTEVLGSIEEVRAKYGSLFRPSDQRVEIKGKVRVVIIEGLDANACGGTHLRSLSEIGDFSVLELVQEAEGRYAASFTLTSLQGVHHDS